MSTVKMSTVKTSTVKQVRSVRNACVLLEAIADGQPVGVSELARTTGLDKSAVHRTAVTLHQVGWIRPAGGPATRWELAPALLGLARKGGTASLVATVRPVMERLRDDTGETVLLAVLEGDRLTVAEVAESRRPLRLSMPAGAEMPVLGSAAARAIAALLPPGEVERLRAAHPGFDDESALERVRSRGWSSNDEEVQEGARAVAAALAGADGLPLGALVVCGPADRMSPDRMRDYGLLTAAAAASAQL
ncbi:IclR family transcriptional regulator [Actinomadura sp. KC345]|uniref:IclR family transcriptional regulator n=1 Tax=Actinomadura sp. KC345 TaxID=2530371 RepID=UPI0010537376|nr:helix-turn-helix domain-containing protein [Actinomadura sp. KC345]TDC56250.1 IclR family transcriptional regulator [Actinomadura sp. KC345]